jgi:hypothetical protein
MVSASDSTPMQYPTMARITHCNQPRRNVREVKVILPFLVPISGAADGITEGSFHEKLQQTRNKDSIDRHSLHSLSSNVQYLEILRSIREIPRVLRIKITASKIPLIGYRVIIIS